MPENNTMPNYIPDPTQTQIKDEKKLVRGIAQVLFIIALVLVLLTAIVDYPRYAPYDPNDADVVTGVDNGFIAISYFGVARASDEDLISTKALKAQLEALQDGGYVTITQQDLFNYYEKGTPLPERALFLMFEDGRRDTAIFAHPLLEELNMHATMVSYANNLKDGTGKFLDTGDIKEIQRTNYWESGTNGYRLSYINVFDRYGRYLGEMTSHEYSLMTKYLERDYNHYLMDFIRDKDDVPTESYNAMAERVATDYALMQDVYTKELGYLPPLYVLMHSNTGAFATNKRVSAVNERELRAAFRANFNREGYCLDRADTDPYDLTRMQPQSYWSTNHLLMRVWYDTQLPQAFVTGLASRAAQWSCKNGAAEYKVNKILLTSLPEGRGTITLNGADYADFELTVRLTGNKLGTQWVGFRADGDDGLSVALSDDVLYILNGEKELYSIPLDELYGTVYPTLLEDSEAARLSAISSKKHYGEQTLENTEILTTLENSGPVASDGYYKPELDLRTPGDTKLYIRMQGDRLTVKANGYTAVEAMSVECAPSGGVFLESACGSVKGGYSQRNLADDVYDGVFEELVIKQGDTVLYDYLPTKAQLAQMRAQEFWDKLVNWFIANL